MSIAPQIELGVDCINCEQDDKILIIIKLCNNLIMIEKIECSGIETFNHDNESNIAPIVYLSSLENIRCIGCVHK